MHPENVFSFPHSKLCLIILFNEISGIPAVRLN